MKLAPLFLRLTSLRKKERGHMKIASRGGGQCAGKSLSLVCVGRVVAKAQG